MTPEPLLTSVLLLPPSPKNQSQYEYDAPRDMLLMNTTLGVALAAAVLKSTPSAGTVLEGPDGSELNAGES